jgi:glyoxylase-like metal-dependent hydrolase (beta-lactamase superfamily II)
MSLLPVDQARPPARRTTLLTMLSALAFSGVRLLPGALIPPRASSAMAAVNGPASAGKEALLAAVPVADGVHVFPGGSGPPDRENAGRVGNLGFVVGRRGVAVIDTGSSVARAQELLDAIRRVTDRPVQVALITHPAQEFLFGAGLFADLGVPVLSHPATPRLMAQRCEHCLETLTGDLGAARMAGTRLSLPTPLALPPRAIDLGGRKLLIEPGPEGSVPGNLTILDDATGVLFTGALLSVRRVPGVQDTRPDDWIRALARLNDAAVRVAVPAYGAVAWRQPTGSQLEIAAAVTQLCGYLRDLEAQVRTLYAAAIPLAELGRHAELDRYRDWNGYPANHLHNIFYRYLQLEAEDLSSQ